MHVTRHNKLTLYELAAEGDLLGGSMSATDVIGEAYEANPDIIVVPVERLDPHFLELRSGIAGEVFQKMEQYGQRLVVLGDIAAPLAESKSLRDFVYETNRRGHHLFAPDHDALLARL